MTHPQRVVPGTTYMITRRCLDRRFYLVPSPQTNAILAYALAYNADKHGIDVHGYGFQSNHVHIVFTDRRGVRPDFVRDLHRDIALALKELHRIPETLWSDAVTSSVELVNEAAVVQSVVYAVLNPVTAGLVARADEWPGVVSLPGTTSLTARRPSTYFSERRVAEATVRITAPPSWTGTEAQWHERLGEMVTDGERQIAEERRRMGIGVLGRERVLKQHPFARPKNRDQFEPKRNPVLSAGGDGAALKAAIASLKAWRSTYRAQRIEWSRDKSAVFPAGTWWVVQRAGASIAA